jgi:hypothetical protein
LGGIRGGRRVDHVVDELDDLAGCRCVAQRFHKVLAHQRTREAGQQLHVLGTTGFRGGDQERQIGGPVGCTEVDGRLEAGEPDGGGVDIGRAAVRDRDATRQPGRRLLLACHRGGDQPVGVGRASGVSEAMDQHADHRFPCVACGPLDIDVEQNQIGVDDRL